jgi:hypothetical protein
MLLLLLQPMPPIHPASAQQLLPLHYRTSPLSHVALPLPPHPITHYISVSDDGIERGAALTRYRMHIDLPTTSLLSPGASSI